MSYWTGATGSKLESDPGLLDIESLKDRDHPIRTQLNADVMDPYEYVLSANLHRRHLTADQKRELIAKVLKAKPEASVRHPRHRPPH
jgi:hypothetical protein